MGHALTQSLGLLQLLQPGDVATEPEKATATSHLSDLQLSPSLLQAGRDGADHTAESYSSPPSDTLRAAVLTALTLLTANPSSYTENNHVKTEPGDSCLLP